MIQAVIFDMDGTLIESESHWLQNELDLFNSLGWKLTAEECLQTRGLASGLVVKHWYDRMPDPGLSVDEITQELNRRMVVALSTKVELKDGVAELLDFWKSTELPLALASASPIDMIEATIERHDFHSYFQVVATGTVEEYHKPHPAIYLSTAAKLKVDPVYTLAFEDSFQGCISAKAARMKLVALLDEGQFNDTKYGFADLKLESFLNFGAAEFEFLKSIM